MDADSMTPEGAKVDLATTAWSFELAKRIAHHEDGTVTYSDWGPPQLSYSEPCVPEGSIRNLMPLCPAALKRD